MSDAETDDIMAQLSEAAQELPQYTKLESDGRKLVLLNLLLEISKGQAPRLHRIAQ
jgi:hypothetical protein